MSRQQLVLATGNAGKVREIGALLDALSLQVLPQTAFDVEDAEETGTTFVENAIIKARNAAQQTGLPALSDDSGIVVPALDGRPGVYSARFAGADASDADNVARLLREMDGRTGTERNAHFCCVVVLMRSAKDPMPLISHGQWHGRIATQPHGDGGFGYDPVFVPNGSDTTAAQWSRAEKNAVSHRAEALRELLPLLTRWHDPHR